MTHTNKNEKAVTTHDGVTWVKSLWNWSDLDINQEVHYILDNNGRGEKSIGIPDYCNKLGLGRKTCEVFIMMNQGDS